MIPYAKYNDIGIKIIEVTVKKRVFQFVLAHPIQADIQTDMNITSKYLHNGPGADTGFSEGGGGDGQGGR